MTAGVPRVIIDEYLMSDRIVRQGRKERRRNGTAIASAGRRAFARAMFSASCKWVNGCLLGENYHGASNCGHPGASPAAKYSRYEDARAPIARRSALAARFNVFSSPIAIIAAIISRRNTTAQLSPLRRIVRSRRQKAESAISSLASSKRYVVIARRCRRESALRC